jgi:hypothetical protein
VNHVFQRDLIIVILVQGMKTSGTAGDIVGLRFDIKIEEEGVTVGHELELLK